MGGAEHTAPQAAGVALAGASDADRAEIVFVLIVDY